MNYENDLIARQTQYVMKKRGISLGGLLGFFSSLMSKLPAIIEIIKQILALRESEGRKSLPMAHEIPDDVREAVREVR